MPNDTEHGLNGTNNQPEQRTLSDLLMLIALFILIAISGIVVWSFHNFEWQGFLAYLVIGFFLGSIAGAVFGMPLLPSWCVMGMAGGLFEGVVQGWHFYGVIGAGLGGVIGIVCGFFIAIQFTAVRCLALAWFGINPYFSADNEGDTHGQ